MLAAPREFPPSSPGSAQAIGEVRLASIEAVDALGDAVTERSRAAVTGRRPTRLLDKLGERLAFERAGARLYEALMIKYRGYGSFDGGPGAEEISRILADEYEHGDLLERVIRDLGGDPTAVTPSANLAATISSGLPQVLTDPRTDLQQCLEAMLVAELADNDGWAALEALAAQAGHGELAAACRRAAEREADHLRQVRSWVAAGQGGEDSLPR
jgi:rubrerythrin